MTPPFHLTRATQAHLDLIAPLFDAYRVFYEQPSDLDAARHFLAKRLTNAEAVIFLALDAPDGQHGLGFTLLYPTFSSVSLARLLILNDLYIAPEARRQGIGQALLKQAQDFAVEAGFAQLELRTAVDNIPAQTLYESLGWQRDTRFYTYTLRP